MAKESVVLNLWTRVLPASREEDWDAIYAEQLPRVYNYFRYRVGTGADAEDLTSLTFEKVWMSRHRYRRDRGGFEAWLFTVARNVAIDHFRRRRVYVPLEEIHEVSPDPNPEEAAERRSTLEYLGTLVARLPEREREILSLKYGAGLTNRAIAAQTELTESNVGTILHRTVEELRAGWKGEF